MTLHLKLIRNIIIVEVNKDLYTQPKFKYAKNGMLHLNLS